MINSIFCLDSSLLLPLRSSTHDNQLLHVLYDNKNTLLHSVKIYYFGYNRASYTCYSDSSYHYLTSSDHLVLIYIVNFTTTKCGCSSLIPIHYIQWIYSKSNEITWCIGTPFIVVLPNWFKVVTASMSSSWRDERIWM
jgi:hypothetical protein